MSDVPSSLAADLDRVVAKLRTTPANRLAAPLSGPFPSRVEAGRALARTLAVACQGIEDADQPAMPAWREVPVLGDLAVGDQVRVLGHDFVVALDGGAERAWTPDGQVPLSELVRDVTATVHGVALFL